MTAKFNLTSIALLVVGALVVVLAAATAVMSVESTATAFSPLPQSAPHTMVTATESMLTGFSAAGGIGNH